jgi:hypothetical protein
MIVRQTWSWWQGSDLWDWDCHLGCGIGGGPDLRPVIACGIGITAEVVTPQKPPKAIAISHVRSLAFELSNRPFAADDHDARNESNIGGLGQAAGSQLIGQALDRNRRKK